jgi:hypothetical protein
MFAHVAGVLTKTLSQRLDQPERVPGPYEARHWQIPDSPHAEMCNHNESRFDVKSRKYELFLYKLMDF